MQSRQFRATLVIAAMLAASGCAPIPKADPDARPLDSGEGHLILWDGSGDLYTVDLSGELVNLAPDLDVESNMPVWSPDGSQIAFTTFVEGVGVRLYAINADGSDPRLLAELPPSRAVRLAIDDVNWSPDGARIVFSYVERLNADVYVVDADGSNLTRLTDSEYYESGPILSPDGSRIAYLMDPGSSSYFDVMVMNADGSDARNLTDDPQHLELPYDWSPDGSKLVIRSDATGDDELYLINIDGSGLTQLTTLGGDVGDAQWSPDGTQIVFRAGRDERESTWNIYRINADGSGLIQLTTGLDGAHCPVWSPDGRWIAFVGGGDLLNKHLYVMNADGSGLTQLSDTPRFVLCLDWQP